MTHFNPLGESKRRAKPKVIQNPLVNVLINLTHKKENSASQKNRNSPLPLPKQQENFTSLRKLGYQDANERAIIGIRTPNLSRNNPHPHRVRHIKGLNGVPICAVHDDEKFFLSESFEDLGFPFFPNQNIAERPISSTSRRSNSAGEGATNLPRYAFKEKAVPGVGICPVIHESWKTKLKELIRSLDANKCGVKSDRGSLKPSSERKSIRLPTPMSTKARSVDQRTALPLCKRTTKNAGTAVSRNSQRPISSNQKWRRCNNGYLPSPTSSKTKVQRCSSASSQCSNIPRQSQNQAFSPTLRKSSSPFVSRCPSRSMLAVTGNGQGNKSPSQMSTQSPISNRPKLQPSKLAVRDDQIVEYPDSETAMMEILALILQTDSIPVVQQWLISAGDRERNFVTEMIKTAIDEEFARAPPLS